MELRASVLYPLVAGSIKSISIKSAFSFLCLHCFIPLVYFLGFFLVSSLFSTVEIANAL